MKRRKEKQPGGEGLADRKYRQGPKRSTRFNEWYLNKEGHKEAKQFFADARGTVPNNPQNAKSFISEGNVVHSRNPYGDGERYATEEAPQFTRPDQWGAFAEGGGATDDAEVQSHVGWGSAPGDGPIQGPRKARGTRFGVGGAPRRNEPMN
jgi:hypothetical protein